MTFLASHADLFDPPILADIGLEPWKPRVLTHEQWPPPYERVYAWRIKTLAQLRADPTMLQEALAYYSTRPAEFICHWMDTYNPRKTTNKWMPFVLFVRQAELIEFFEELRRDSENGLVEKCRDAGVTWIGCAYSVWCWRFLPGDATGWGSRKEELVDKLGDPDSIFEKIRLLIQRLPDVFKPSNMKQSFMKVANNENGATITGESGDNIGRGGRKSRYMKDESAHYERPELIEAALGDNTDVQIDISSVNGLGNVFHRRREAGVVWEPGTQIERGMTRVFIFDWRDHPEKTQEWYDLRKARAEREGMQHIFAQEVDRNYSAAVQNTIIAFDWIEAAVDAHFHIPALRVPPSDEWMAGFDLADEGGDQNALILRNGVILRHAEQWGERDPGVSTRKLLIGLRENGRRGIKVQYDCIGIGSNVKSEYNRLIDSGEIEFGEFHMVPWHAGASVQQPFARIIPDDNESPRNRDFFGNMKAQAWWALRTRFYKTWRARTYGDVYDYDELISISSDIPSGVLHQLKKELAQPTRSQTTGSLKLYVEKKPNGTKSPNLGDATVQAYFPAPENGGSAETGHYGG
jgi:phage terminase large subunit